MTPLAGFRVWRVGTDERGRGQLMPLHTGTDPWVPGQAAVCAPGRRREGCGPAPGPECHCGFSAWATLAAAEAMLLGRDPDHDHDHDHCAIGAIVVGHGRVQCHQDGWRAEHIEVVALGLDTDTPQGHADAVRSAAAAYGALCVRVAALEAVAFERGARYRPPWRPLDILCPGRPAMGEHRPQTRAARAVLGPLLAHRRGSGRPLRPGEALAGLADAIGVAFGVPGRSVPSDAAGAFRWLTQAHQDPADLLVPDLPPVAGPHVGGSPLGLLLDDQEAEAVGLEALAISDEAFSTLLTGTQEFAFGSRSAGSLIRSSGSRLPALIAALLDGPAESRDMDTVVWLLGRAGPPLQTDCLARLIRCAGERSPRVALEALVARADLDVRHGPALEVAARRLGDFRQLAGRLRDSDRHPLRARAVLLAACPHPNDRAWAVRQLPLIDDPDVFAVVGRLVGADERLHALMAKLPQRPAPHVWFEMACAQRPPQQWLDPLIAQALEDPWARWTWRYLAYVHFRDTALDPGTLQAIVDHPDFYCPASLLDQRRRCLPVDLTRVALRIWDSDQAGQVPRIAADALQAMPKLGPGLAWRTLAAAESGVPGPEVWARARGAFAYLYGLDPDAPDLMRWARTIAADDYRPISARVTALRALPDPDPVRRELARSRDPRLREEASRPRRASPSRLLTAD